jgi:hypothetical protein
MIIHKDHSLEATVNSFGEWHAVIDGQTVLTWSDTKEAALMEGRRLIDEMALQD